MIIIQRLYNSNKLDIIKSKKATIFKYVDELD